MRTKSVPARGYTLLEILVVIVLISLVTSFTIPQVRTSLFSDQLKATSRRLVGFINEVSQDALSSQSEYVVNFNLDANEVWATTGTGSEDEENDTRKKTLTLPDQVRISEVKSVSSGPDAGGTVKLYFSKKGYVDKTAIHLRSDDGRDMTIILSPFMGVTRIFDSYVDLADERARF